jgi:predicted CXXCH cytochrome family protein
MMSLCTFVVVVCSFFAVHFAFIGIAEAASHAVCSDCHLRGKTLKAATVDALCLSCHPDNTKDHVLGVIPQTSPSLLPLDRDNKMTCISCHDAHAMGKAVKLLRMDKSSLCIACHLPK